MDSSGNFQSMLEIALSITDSSIAAASGYSGLTAGASTGGGQSAIYTDDWVLSAYSSPPSPTTHATMYDRVKETSQTQGVGPLLLEGAESGFQDFSIVGNGNYVYYCILDRVSFTWEVGLGSYDTSGPYLHRLLVYDGSFGPGNLVNFVFPGIRDVFNTCPAWLLNALMALV
jgi:hypothetical protein